MSIDVQREQTAIDLLATMVVAELATRQQRDPSVVMPEFLASRTAQLLYDPTTKTWWQGPSDVVEQYLREKNSAR